MTSDRRTSTAHFRAAIALGAAVLVLIAGIIQRVSVDDGYRHTRAVTATVVQIDANRIAEVTYLIDGQQHSAPIDITSQSGVRVGNRLALRVSTNGTNTLSFARSTHTVFYQVTASALLVIAIAFLIEAWIRRRRELRRISGSWRAGHRTVDIPGG